MIALTLYGPVLNDHKFIVEGSGNDGRVVLGAFLEAILAISVVGTAVTLFPIVRRQNESVALGYLAGRVTEAMVILVGV